MLVTSKFLAMFKNQRCKISYYLYSDKMNEFKNLLLLYRLSLKCGNKSTFDMTFLHYICKHSVISKM